MRCFASLLLCFACACRAQRPEDPALRGESLTPSLNASDWQGLCMGGNPCAADFFSNDSAGDLTFNFPVEDTPSICYAKGQMDNCPSVNYVFTPAGKGWPSPGISITKSSQVTLTFTIVTTGSVVWFYDTDGTENNCGGQATTRLFLWQWLDADTGGDRWWSSPVSAILGPGTFTLTVPLIPSQWSNVNGDFGTTDSTGWNDLLTHLEYAGVTFGGGCFFGHGVNISGGSAQYILTSVSFSRGLRRNPRR